MGMRTQSFPTTGHSARGMEPTVPCVEQGGPPGGRGSRPIPPDSSIQTLSRASRLSSPRFPSPPAVSLTPPARALSFLAFAAGDELELELVPRIEDDGRGMEPMNVDNGGCGGLDAQIEQLMQCRPLAEQEVRSSPAIPPFHSGFQFAGLYFAV